jgi:energy-coupling factor transporter ATP-binding protein EcfA2
MIETQQLCYGYTRAGLPWVLQNLDLRLEPGAYALLCGASGSGKSTLCRTFNGLIPHFYGGALAGKVWVAGLDTRLHPVSELFVHVGMVFQNPEAQLFNSTVERELAFGLESLGLARSEIRRRVAESAELVGLSTLLTHPPHDLSGGEQQLVIIAAALALRPQVMVLDEPYANLDPAHVRRVRTALKAINRQGTAIVLAEHRLHHAVADVDRMLVLQQGRLVLDGPPKAVLQEGVAALGLQPPPVVRVAQTLDLAELPLSVAELKAAINGLTPPLDLGSVRSSPAKPPGESLLQLENVSFAFDEKPVLNQVNLDLRAGECLAIVGANGAGKTTLIKHLNGLYRPTQGRVVVMGQETHRAKVSHLARRVGVAFQNANNQFFKFRVWDEIAAGAQALACYDEAWLRELVRLFHLEPLLDRSPYRLSEGEKKRVAFASALAARPDILVIDEPTAGQDWTFRQILGNFLNELQARGQTTVLVTHDLEFAETHADRWLLLAEGEVLTSGSPGEVMANGLAMRRAGLEPTQTFQITEIMRQPELSSDA